MSSPDVLDEIETWERPAQDEFESELLAAQLQQVLQTSEFYRDKFAAAGVDAGTVTGVADLPLLPFTEKRELRESLADHPPLGRHLAVPVSALVQIQATSGTSGSPSYFGLTEADLHGWGIVGSRAFYAGGFRPGDVVLHGWGLSRGFAGGVPGVRVLQQLGCVVLPIGGEAGAERLLQVARDMRPRGFCSGPQFAIHIATVAQDVLGIPAYTLGIKHLVVGGEPGGGIDGIRSRIERLWGATSCETLGNSDVTPIVFAECQDRSGMHLVAQGITRTELIDPETGEILPWESGVGGELVLTALRREASPLIRFRTRDYLEVLDEACACGRRSPKVRCTGRTDDMLIVRGVNVWPSAVQQVVSTMHPQVTGNLRIVADFEGHSTERRLAIRVELAPGLDDRAAEEVGSVLERRITQRLAFRPRLVLEKHGVLPALGINKTALVERAETAPTLPTPSDNQE